MGDEKTNASARGDRLRAAIEEAGLTQTRFERVMGHSQGSLSRIINGERGERGIDPLKMQLLARQLGLKFEWLVLGEGPKRDEEIPFELVVARCAAADEAVRRGAPDALPAQVFIEWEDSKDPDEAVWIRRIMRRHAENSNASPAARKVVGLAVAADGGTTPRSTRRRR